MIFMDERSLCGDRLFRIENRLKRFIINTDRIQSLLENFPAFGCHQGYGIPAMPHFFLRQNRLVLADHALLVCAPHILRSQHFQHPRQAPGILGADIFYEAVRNAGPLYSGP